MSARAHFWLRVAGLALILVAEFGPKLPKFWSQTPSTARVASVTAVR